MVTQMSTGNSLLQLNVPDELRGRLMSLFGLIVMGFAPVGSIIYGITAHYSGPGPAIAGGSLWRPWAPALCCCGTPTCALDFTDLGPTEAGHPAANHFPAFIKSGRR